MPVTKQFSTPAPSASKHFLLDGKMEANHSALRKFDPKCKLEPNRLFNPRAYNVSWDQVEKYGLELYPDTKEIARFANLVYAKDEEKFIQGLNKINLGLNGTEKMSLANWSSNSEAVLNNHPNIVMDSACTFTHNVLSHLYLYQISQFQVILTGHSLGGWLAQISSFSIKYLELEGTSFFREGNGNRFNPHCVTFDSPGTIQTFDYLNEKLRKKKSLRLDITNYVILPNLINVLNGHFGDLVKIPTDPLSPQLDDLAKNANIKNLYDNLFHSGETHDMDLFLLLLGVTSAEGNVMQAGSGKDTKNRPIYKPSKNPKKLLRIIKNWPELLYKEYTEEKPSWMVPSVWKFYNSGGTIPYEAYLRNPKKSIRTVEYCDLFLQLCRITEKEKSFADFLEKLTLWLSRNDEEELLKRVLGILFPISVPLFKLMKLDDTKCRIWPFLCKDNGDLDFKKGDYKAFKCFKNILIWNEFPSEGTSFSEKLWNWVKGSIAYYDGVKRSHILPKFEDGSPKLGTEDDYESLILRPRQELMLIILEILGQKYEKESIILKCLKEVKTDIEDGVKLLKKCGSVSRIILDFSEYVNEQDIRDLDFNEYKNEQECRAAEIRKKVKIYRLVHSNDSNSSNNGKFSLVSEKSKCLDNIMAREIFCEDFKKRKYLSDFVDSGNLICFLKENPNILLQLLKRDKRIVVGPFTRTIFDSEFTYFQVGETYSLITPRDKSIMGLVQYYETGWKSFKRGGENSNTTGKNSNEGEDDETFKIDGKSSKACSENFRKPGENPKQSGKKSKRSKKNSKKAKKDSKIRSESSKKTIIVFIYDSKNELNKLKYLESTLKKIPNLENVLFVQAKPEYFQKFSNICKTNSSNFVDLIWFRGSSIYKEEWRFDHLLQYNPDFYFPRKIIPPQINLEKLCKEILTAYSIGDLSIPKIKISHENVAYENIHCEQKFFPIVNLEEILNFGDSVCFVQFPPNIKLEESITKSVRIYDIDPEKPFSDGHLCIKQQSFIALWPKYLIMGLMFENVGEEWGTKPQLNFLLLTKETELNKERDKVYSFVPNPFIKAENISFCDCKFIILSDEPGMGKSTTTAKLLPTLAPNENEIAVLIELKNIVGLDTFNNTTLPCKEAFIKFISQNLEGNILSKFLFQEAVLGDKFILTVVFDGYDELVKSQREDFKKMLTSSWGIHNVRVIVSTRPDEQTNLEAALCTFSHAFVPIESTGDKVNFLVNIWAGILRCDEEALTTLAEKIIAKAHTQFMQGRESFLGVPLQLRILGEISLDLARKWLVMKDDEKKGKVDKFVEEHSNLGTIYEDFLNRKLNIYVQEKLRCVTKNQEIFDSIKNANEPTFYWLAGKFLELGDVFSFLTTIPHTSYYDRVKAALKIGIVFGRNDGKLPQFLHKTFAEYYAAKCLFEVVKKAYLDEDPHCSLAGEYLLSFIFCNFVVPVKNNAIYNQVIWDFFTEMLKNDEKIFKALNEFELFNFAYPERVKDVWDCPHFLSVRDPCVANFMMIGWSEEEMTEYVRDLKLHVLFILDGRLELVDVALSAILRKFSTYFKGDFMTAPFLCCEKKKGNFSYFSLNDAFNFFDDNYSGQTSICNMSRQEFTKQFPILSCIIIDENKKFKVKERFEYLFGVRQTKSDNAYFLHDVFRTHKDKVILEPLSVPIIKEKLPDLDKTLKESDFDSELKALNEIHLQIFR